MMGIGSGMTIKFDGTIVIPPAEDDVQRFYAYVVKPLNEADKKRRREMQNTCPHSHLSKSPLHPESEWWTCSDCGIKLKMKKLER
jgi:hypothetical protein